MAEKTSRAANCFPEEVRAAVQAEANRKRSQKAKDQPRPAGGKFGTGARSNERAPSKDAGRDKTATAGAKKTGVSRGEEGEGQGEDQGEEEREG